MSLLQVKKLTMRFGGLTAVKDLSLTIEPGQIFSLIGPNGAGKTTAFNAITGIYPPTEGTVQFQEKPTIRCWNGRMTLLTIAIGLLTAVGGFFAGGQCRHALEHINQSPPQQRHFQLGGELVRGKKLPL
jgi:ABC-type multidrug transport system ATPase subunit